MILEHQHEHHHYETEMDCDCPCHGTSGECSICSVTHGPEENSPVNMAISMWRKAFFEAHMQFMTEKLKKRMEAAWGPTADKAADAVLETMGKQWMAMIQQTAAEQELHERMAKIFKEEK